MTPYTRFVYVAQALREPVRAAGFALLGVKGYPNLSEGLRFDGDLSEPHFLMIHKDDADEFVRRFREWDRHGIAP